MTLNLRAIATWLLCLCSCAGSLRADTFVWQGPTPGTDWNTAENWQIEGGGNGVPNSSTAFAIIDTNNPSISADVELGSSTFGIAGLFVGADNSLTIQSSTISVGDYENNGTIHLSSSQLNVGEAFPQQDFNMEGTGTLVLEGGILRNLTGYTMLHAAGHTIIGSGSVGGRITNQGTIRGGTSLAPLTLDGENLHNESLILASNSEVIRMHAVLTQSTTGVMRAAAGQIILAHGSGTRGGTLESTSGGSITTNSAHSNATNRLAAVRFTSGTNYRSFANNQTYFEGPITNDGTIQVDGPADLNRDGVIQPAMQGSGKLVLNGGSATTGPGATFTNGSGHTIEGAGTLSGPVVNQGLIQANRPGETLTLNLGSMNNSGTLEANGGTLHVQTNTINSGVMLASAGVLIIDSNLQNEGELRATAGGEIHFANGNYLQSGRITGNGTYSSDYGLTLGNAVRLAPGNSPGTMYVEGHLSMFGIAEFELATPGIAGSEVNDLVVVDGDVTLYAGVEITALAGFGEGVYRLFDYTGSILAQELVLLITPPDYLYTIDYSTPSQVNLVVSAVPEPSATVLLLGSIGFSIFWRRRGQSFV